MKLRVSSVIPQNPALFWLEITLLVWWLGVAGRDFYLLPAFVFLGVCFYQTRKKPFPKILTKSNNHFSGKHWPTALFLGHIVLFLTITILKYYSFRWNIWDVGNYSNMLHNISLGRFYSSYLEAHNWADHFTPSMSPLALFYLLTPSVHWITLSKTAAYISVPLLLYKICREVFQKKERAWSVTVILGFAWMLFYAPALNSLYYEFQPSALAPPFILYAFLCFRRKQRLRFWLTMLILLGFKEHLGAVWIGFGCFMVLETPHKKVGILLISGGMIAVYFIMFQIMPYFRNYQESWSMAIGPFENIPQKAIYLFKILAPLAFLPIIFWRIGVMAGPAIGVNLVSSSTNMYSTVYHYDDISATLLMLVMLLVFSSLNIKNSVFWGNRKWKKWLIAGWFVCTLGLLPSSPMRELYAAIPDNEHWQIRRELLRFDEFSKGQAIAVQTSLGPHFNRTNILAVTQNKNGNCVPIRRSGLAPKSQYFVFAQSLNHYLIGDLKQCLSKFILSSDYLRLSDYHYLSIFKKLN